MAQRGELISLGAFELFGSAVLGPSDSDQRTSRPQDAAGSGHPSSYLLSEVKKRSAIGGDFLPSHESEVYVKGNRVIWSAGRHIRKRFTAPGSVRQAAWCLLAGDDEPVLALLLADCIITYSSSGATYTIPFNFEPAAIWPIPYGLLVQVSSDQAPDTYSRGASVGPSWGASTSGASGGSATLLSMLHPLEDLQGVHVRAGTGSDAVFADPHETVLWSSSTVPYIVTHHAVNQRHSIWKVHPPAPVPSQHPHTSSPLSTPPPSSSRDSTTPAYLIPIEDPPVTSLTRIWTQTSNGKRAAKALYAHDEEGTRLLCLLIRETSSLVLLRVAETDAEKEGPFGSDGGDGGASVSVAGVLPAVAAEAVEGSRKQLAEAQGRVLDLLLLTRDGSLMLHMGAYAVCQLSPPSPTSAPPPLPAPSIALRSSDGNAADRPPEISVRSSASRGGRGRSGAPARKAKETVVTPPVTSAAPKVADLRDAVGNRVNLVFADGLVLRTAVRAAPESPLVAACLTTLALVLPLDLRWAFVSRLLGGPSEPSPESLGEAEWGAFAGLVRGWVTGVVALTPGAKSGQKEAKSVKSVKKGAESRRKAGGVSEGSTLSRRSSDDEAQSDWELLLQSDLYRATLEGGSYEALELPLQIHGEETSRSPATPLAAEPFPSVGSPDADLAVVRRAVEALHLVYEDLKLDTLKWRSLFPLASLLHSLAGSLSLVDYQDYYSREWSSLPSPEPASPTSVLDSTFLPLDLHGLLRDMLAQPRGSEDCVHTVGEASGSGQAGPFGTVLPDLLRSSAASPLSRSRQILALYDILVSEKSLRNVHGAGQSPAFQIPVKVTRGTARSAAHSVVLVMVAEGIALSDLDTLPSGVALPIRHALYACREAPPPDWPAPAFDLIGREDLATARLGTPSSDTPLLTPPYAHHLRPIEPLESDEAFEGSGDPPGDGMEPAAGARARARFRADLRLDEVRRLLGSAQPVAVRVTGGPELADPDLVAHQQTLLWQLAQRTTALPAGRGAFTLASAGPILTEALPVPKLVLAGRLPTQQNATVNLDVSAGQSLTDLTTWPEFHNGVAAGLRLAPGQAKITRTWISYNTPETPTPSHAGVLLALGLAGHLRILAATDIYRYLAQEHDVTTVGVLLGMAAAHRGTLNPVISKMLYLHIPARHPPSFPELELPPLVQSAALMAVGLLYQGSAHRLTTEILLAEIGRKPGIDAAVDREGYALSAGLALGLVCLGRGNEAVGLADLHIEDRLHHYLAGGSERSTRSRARELALGMPKPDEFEATGEQILEGDMVNVDVTAPGATLALALMFLKTNNTTVAARLKIPDTHFDLEYVRPDFILLRVLARSLILWDGVAPTEAWVAAQVPAIIKRNVERKGRFATIEEESDEKEGEVDTEALAQAHVNILAGACFAIGLRFAGTGNEDARAILYKYAMQFVAQKRGAPAVSSGDSKRVDKGTLETCLNVAALSLSVVMAGTGHLPTLRLLRHLRRRMPGEGEVSHGNHMAISMALGFLFMGGGARTFATSNEATAALVIALYPRFPQAPNDHRCHLQAFRHLYVLATEDRCVEAVDVDTNQPVFVPLEITVAEGGARAETTYTRVTPCLLPERAHLKRVRVCGPRYWPHVIDLQSEAATSSRRQSALDLNIPPHPDLSDQDRRSLGLGLGTVAEGLVAAKAARLHPSTPGGGSGGGTPRVTRNRDEGSAGLRRSRDEDPDLAAIDGRMRTLYVKRRAAGAGTGMVTSSAGSHRRALTMSAAGGEADAQNDPAAAFSADPSMLAFADHFCTSAPSDPDARAFAAFCCETLDECMTSEKPAAVQAYVDLYTSVHRTAKGLAEGEAVDGRDCLAVANLKVALGYCSRFDHSEDPPSIHTAPLLRPSFLATLHKRVEMALETADLEGPESPLAAYLNPQTPSLSGRPHQKAALGLYLSFHDFPTAGRIAQARKELSRFGGADLGGLMKAPLLSLLLPRTPQNAILRLATSL